MVIYKKETGKRECITQMKEKLESTDYTVWFIDAVIVCSMLLVFPFRIGGIEALPVALFTLCIGWACVSIVRINWGGIKPRTYIRLDLAAVLLALYETGSIAVDVFRKIKEDEPEVDYSWNLLVIDLVFLYLLVMETRQFRETYLDLVLYTGLAAMAFLLLGYLADPQFGAFLGMWEEKTEAASYLLLTSIVSVLQYCHCRDRMKEWFYGMCAAVSFFLLGCNHSVVSFWILAVTMLMIPIVETSTVRLWKKTARMLLLFPVMLSGISLLSNYTKLFLVPVRYDTEQSVCLGFMASAGAAVFFYCWDRIPEDAGQDSVVMRGLRRMDQRIVTAVSMVGLFFVTDAFEWQSGRRETVPLGTVRKFAVSFIGEIEENHSFWYWCMLKQGMAPILLGIPVFVLCAERLVRVWRRDKPVDGTPYIVAGCLFLQMLAWEVSWNVLPVAVICTADAIACNKER